MIAQEDVSEDEVFTTLERAAWKGVERRLECVRAPITRVPWDKGLSRRTLVFDLELARIGGVGVIMAAVYTGVKVAAIALDQAVEGTCWRLEVAFTHFVDEDRAHLAVGWRVVPV